MVWLAGVTPGVASLKDEAIAEIAKRSIVYIAVKGVRSDTGAIEEYNGTGFLISRDGFVVTAKHILQDKDGKDFQRSPELTGVVGGGRVRSNGIPLEIVARHYDQDVALLKLEEADPELVPATACTETPAAGAKMIAFGFALGQPLAITPGVFNHDSGPQALWQVTMDLTHGMSGGPVYDENGRLRAIVKGGVRGEPAVRWVIPVRFIDSWLRAHETRVACNTDWIPTVSCLDNFLIPFRRLLTQTESASEELRAFLGQPNLEGAPDYIQIELNRPENGIWRNRARTLLGHNRSATELIQAHGSCVKNEGLEKLLDEFFEHADKVAELWDVILSEQPPPIGANNPHVQTRFPDGLEDAVDSAIRSAEANR